MSNNHRFFVVFGFVLAAAFGGCGQSAPQWKTFHDSTAGFSADFPGDVTRPQGIEKSGTGAPTTYNFECRTPDGLTYTVSFIAQPNKPEQITKRLDSLKQLKLATDSNYTSLAIDPVTAGSAQGVEQIFKKESAKYGKGFMRVRMFVVPKGDFTLTVDSATSADADSADVTRFLNSFKIDPAK